MIKLITSLLIFCVLFFKNVYSAEIKDIVINGNTRITDETILVFSGVNLTNEINSSLDLNRILKKLYNTNYFSDVTVDFKKNKLIINVVENPIIQSVQITGIKAKKFKNLILENLVLKEKTSYVENFVSTDINRIKSIMKRSGFYFVNVDLNVIEAENSSVILSYQIDLGKKAKIRNIKFIGKKLFKDRKLRNVIVSEEYKPWKFLTSKKYLNEDRIELDKRLLKNFYLNRGYFNVTISTFFAEYLSDNEFDLTYSIEAGNKLFFNDLKLKLSDDYDIDQFEEVQQYFSKIKGKHYSLVAIEKISNIIENITVRKQLEFLSVSIEENVKGKNKLDILFNLKQDQKKFYVNRINILGNDITEESVIRNQLLVDEGDPLNRLLFNKSINHVKALNIFGDVKTNIIDSGILQKKDIDIIVEEKATGEISAGAGVGTSGGTVGFNLSENNYLGKGLKVGTNLTLNEESIKGSLNYTNPNYKNSNKALVFGLFSKNTDRLTEFGYKSSNTGFSLGTGYEQFEDLYFTPKFSASYDKIETSNDASPSIKKQKGDYLATKIVYDLDYDKRNRKYQPSSGHRHLFSQAVPIYSKTYALKNTYEFNQYYQVSDTITAGISIYGSMINSLKSKDVRISERIGIPQKKLRGFESGKIGPKDGNDFVGGNYASSINFYSDLPVILENSQSTDVKFFFDAANVWGADFKDNDGASSKIRSSAGLALDWFTPVGPLNFSFAKPITKKSTDVTESFRFNIGTTF